MANLYLPPGVTREMLAERQQHTADVLRHLEVKGHIDHWNRELRKIDERLQLVKAFDDTTLPGLKGGYWHVLKINPGAPPDIFIHQGPNGEYRDPDSGLLRELAESDMWSDKVRKHREERRKKFLRAQEREQEREREERLEELKDRAKFHFGKSVAFPKGLS